MRRIEETGSISFQTAVVDFWHGLFSFGGRSTVAGYWWAILNVFITQFVLLLCAMALMTFGMIIPIVGIPIMFIVTLALWVGLCVLMIGEMAVLFRRLRDVGLKLSAILALILIPLVLGLTILMVITYMVFVDMSGTTVFLILIQVLIMLACGIITLVLTCLPSDACRTSSSNRFVNFWVEKKKETQSPKSTEKVEQPNIIIYPDGTVEEQGKNEKH